MNKTFSLLLTLILLAFGMVLLNCGNDSHPAPTPTPTQAPSFAFMQEVPGQTYIFTPMLGKLSASGGNVTFSASPLKDPSNGQPLAADFYSITLGSDHKRGALDLYGGLDGNSGQWDIWVGNVTDASAVQISNDTYDDATPQLSPNGTKVVYASYRPISGSWQWQIIIRNADGSGGELVLPFAAGTLYQWHPAYSPDGSKIAVEASGYDVNNVPYYGIWIMNADGTNPQMLTNPLYSEACYNCRDWDPAFSADGSTIAFVRYDDDTMTSDIYVMNASDGGNVTKLTDGVGLNSDPMFVTIGQSEMLLFASNRDNPTLGIPSGFELYSVNIDGTGLTRLTNNSLFDAFSGEWYEFADTLARHAPRQHSLYQQHHTSRVHW